MDKASDYESGDSRFESWQGRDQSFTWSHGIRHNSRYHVLCSRMKRLPLHIVLPSDMVLRWSGLFNSTMGGDLKDAKPQVEAFWRGVG